MVSTSREPADLYALYARRPSELRNFLGPGLIFGGTIVVVAPLFVDGGTRGRLSSLPRRSRQCRRRQRPTA